MSRRPRLTSAEIWQNFEEHWAPLSHSQPAAYRRAHRNFARSARAAERRADGGHPRLRTIAKSPLYLLGYVVGLVAVIALVGGFVFVLYEIGH